ncbi:MAG: tail fiber domain-containing protein [Ruthenibacterium sp.]
MAKQGSIKHYRQSGAVKEPTSLPFGELAVAKDGTIYAGNESNAPVSKTENAAQCSGNAATVGDNSTLLQGGSIAAATWLAAWEGDTKRIRRIAPVNVKVGNADYATNGNSTFTLNGSGYLHLKMGEFGEMRTSPNDSSMNLMFNGGVFVMNKANSAMVPVHASSFVTSSSRKYKEHIIPLTQTQAQALLDFQVVQYDYIAGEKNQFGVIAEDVAKIQQQGVYFDAANAPDAVDYSKFVPQLIALCQAQQKQIDALQVRVNALTVQK